MVQDKKFILYLKRFICIFRYLFLKCTTLNVTTDGKVSTYHHTVNRFGIFGLVQGQNLIVQTQRIRQITKLHTKIGLKNSECKDSKQHF